MHDATLFGETVHVLADQTLSPEQMLRADRMCPHKRLAIREISPSLEDVFVTLTANAEAKCEANAPPDAGDRTRSTKPARQTESRVGRAEYRSPVCGLFWSRSFITFAGNR